jgi:aerobic carbon-monoxide dehydrogenase medium subunit
LTSILAVKPAPFEYYLPDTVEEALALMGEHGADARPLAGGQSLVPMMNFRLARPSVLIDINRLPALAGISTGPGTVRLGAMVREKALERSDVIAAGVPLLACALPLIGHEAIRSRGTIGGSLSHSDPAAELPAVAVAAGARLTAVSAARGSRVIAAEDFFTSHFTTALEDDELLIEVEFPVADGSTGAAFEEMARRHGDFAIVGVATTLRVVGGVIDAARLVLTGVSSTPFRSRAAEAVLLAAEPSEAVFAEAAEAVAAEIDPPADLHGSSAYRRYVAATLTRRSLSLAAQRIGAQS